MKALSCGRTPLCAASGLAFHDVGHPLGQRGCDGRGRRYLVHHAGKGDAAIHVDNHRAGIVADSIPVNEYEETLNKARGLLRALEMAEKQL